MSGAKFDWVTARQKICSGAAFLEQLRLDAIVNVNTRNGLTPGEPIFEVAASANAFSVLRQAAGGTTIKVEFRLDGQDIRFDGYGLRDGGIKGTLTLTDEEQCRLKVDGKDLIEWQVLRLALEPIFFNSSATRR